MSASILRQCLKPTLQSQRLAISARTFSARYASGITVCKFGGTSMATPESVNTVKGIMESTPHRRVLVVSAPGRRFKGDMKVTDLLIKLDSLLFGAEKSIEAGTAHLDNEILPRFHKIIASLGAKPKGDPFAVFRTEVLDRASKADGKVSADGRSAHYDYVVSRGEYLCGLTMSEALGYDFVDPSSHVFLNGSTIDYTKTLSALKGKLDMSGTGKFVMPGFYGYDMDISNVGVLPRGGSDVSGALCAQAIDAAEYENWTDVDGVYTADPNVFKNAKKIEQLSHDELRTLGSNGAQVLHPGTVANNFTIPVHLRNTFNEKVQGTAIVAQQAAGAKVLGLVVGASETADAKSIKIVGPTNADFAAERKKVTAAVEAAMGKDAISIKSGQDPWVEVDVPAKDLEQAGTHVHGALDKAGLFTSI